MSLDDYFWKAFEATGSPQLYMMYKSKKKQNPVTMNGTKGMPTFKGGPIAD